MSDLPAEVRDRAAQAAFDAFYRGSLNWETATESFKDRWRVVAEVLAAEQVFPFRTPEQHHARYLELLGPVVRERDELKARVQQLTAAYTDLEAHRPPEYPALRARVDELTAALTEMVLQFDGRGFNAARQEATLDNARAVLAAAVERGPE